MIVIPLKDLKLYKLKLSAAIERKLFQLLSMNSFILQLLSYLDGILSAAFSAFSKIIIKYISSNIYFKHLIKNIDSLYMDKESKKVFMPVKSVYFRYLMKIMWDLQRKLQLIVKLKLYFEIHGQNNVK